MKTTTLITHGIWAVLAVSAFIAGRGPLSEKLGIVEPAPGEGAGVGNRPADSRPEPAAWTSGPGDSPEEFSAEMAVALSEPDEEIRKTRALDLMEELTPQVLDGLTEEMVPGLLEALKLADDQSWYRTREFMRAWARLDPRAAFAFVTDPASKLSWMNKGREAMILEWAQNDPAAARSALIGLEEDAPRWEMANNLMKSLVETDLDAAIAFSTTLQRETGTGPSMYDLVRRLHRERGVEGVQELLDGIDAAGLGEGSAAYEREVVGSLAYLPETSTVELLVANADDPVMTSSMVVEIAKNRRSPSGKDRTLHALDWIAKLPEEVGQRREALGTQFEKYMKKDFEAAGAWLAAQQLDSRHDEAILIFARSATMDDVPTAMLWAGQISDPELKAEAVQYIRDRGGR